MLGTLALPQRTAQYAARPTPPPAASTAGMRCVFMGLRVPLSSNAREVLGADSRADTGGRQGGHRAPNLSAPHPSCAARISASVR